MHRKKSHKYYNIALSIIGMCISKPCSAMDQENDSCIYCIPRPYHSTNLQVIEDALASWDVKNASTSSGSSRYFTPAYIPPINISSPSPKHLFMPKLNEPADPEELELLAEMGLEDALKAVKQEDKDFRYLFAADMFAKRAAFYADEEYLEQTHENYLAANLALAKTSMNEKYTSRAFNKELFELLDALEKRLSSATL